MNKVFAGRKVFDLMFPVHYLSRSPQSKHTTRIFAKASLKI